MIRAGWGPGWGWGEAGRAGALCPEDKLFAYDFFLKESQTLAALSRACVKWATCIRVAMFYLRVFPTVCTWILSYVFQSTYLPNVNQRSQLRSGLLLRQRKICHAWMNGNLLQLAALY